MSDFSIFLSWGGDEARTIAEWLKAHIFDGIPRLTTFVSSKQTTGAVWVSSIDTALARANSGIVILTEESLDRPWPIYEFGYLRGKQEDSLALLRFCPIDEVPPPLSFVQMADGCDINALREALSSIPYDDNRMRDEVCNRLATHAPRWGVFLNEVLNNNGRQARLRLLKALSGTRATVNRLAHSDAPLNNPCMTEVSFNAVGDLQRALAALPDRREIELPFRRYPEYLIRLQSNKVLKCVVRAVACLDDIEEFWLQPLGREIAETSNSKSRRVFVVKDDRALERYLPSILNHSGTYTVKLLSYGKYRTACADAAIKPGDFSVFESSDGHGNMLAYYHRTNLESAARINFSVQADDINRHMTAFDDIFQRAVDVPAWTRQRLSIDDEDLNRAQAELSKTLFRGQTAGATAQLHSDVIPLSDYEMYEPDHPYFGEMHEAMLRELQANFGAIGLLRVLEIGAGTGHFTKRLLELGHGITVVALDPDPPAVKLLRHKFRDKPNIRIVEANGASFVPDKPFSAVVSSFSEHHIPVEDKSTHFENVARCLAPGGVFIIGDEFLRDHSPSDWAAYEHALSCWHQYVIDLANRAGKKELARLERLAWESGLGLGGRRVDFKTTVAEFTRQAKSAGFGTIRNSCISDPAVEKEVGGIYVLVLRHDGKPHN